MLDLLGCNRDFDEQPDDETFPDVSPNTIELNEPGCLVHPLIFCPPIAKDTRYVLVIRKPWGQRIGLSRGMTASPHPSLNLARIRQEGATLGANEVHVMM